MNWPATLLGATPRQIIAVHLNYRSRARQRGRTPAQPSYFLKTFASLTSSGSAVHRPAGTQLLTVEGEIAVVIGSRARSVTPEQGWGCIKGFTAALDLGIQDLKSADRGSNLRSKGSDGLTPIGPGLITEGIGPGQVLRVRTWRGDQLIQDDDTAGMLFDVGYLIADLSRSITLSPGDLILTGTPAGAGVAVPGDQLACEVDVPATGASTGRLRAQVVDGPALAGWGAQPQVSEQDRIDAWGSRAAAGLAATGDSGDGSGDGSPDGSRDSSGDGSGDDGRARAATVNDASAGTDAPAVGDELLRRAAAVSTATLSSQVRRRGYENTSIDGVRRLGPGSAIAGRARTLRLVAHRPDLFATRGGGYNAQKRAFDTLLPGDVLVVEARGEAGTGTLGDILALRAVQAGAAGVVTDGGVRDSSTVGELGLPVFSAGPHPAVLGRRHVPWETDTAITCGGAAVLPGDLVVGDQDGVVIVPAAIAAEVVADSLEQERQERFIAEQVQAGAALDGLYPMNEHWRARYRTWDDAAVAPASAMTGGSA